MINENIEAIIFDFGGVIINIDYSATINAFKALGIDNFDSLYSQASQSDLFNNIETGKISPQHFINGLLQILPKGITPNQVVKAWNAMLQDIPLERIELLLELKKTHPIYLLSNTNSIHIDAALRTWNATSSTPITEVFNAVYYSHDLNMRKPNKEIFDFVCSENSLNASKTLFIDDSIQHIEGAQSAGLQTMHLKDGLTIQELFS